MALALVVTLIPLFELAAMSLTPDCRRSSDPSSNLSICLPLWKYATRKKLWRSLRVSRIRIRSRTFGRCVVKPARLNSATNAFLPSLLSENPRSKSGGHQKMWRYFPPSW